jgi:hypothetical protein
MKSMLICVLVWYLVSLTFAANGHPWIANGQINWINYFFEVMCTAIISFVIDQIFKSKND